MGYSYILKDEIKFEDCFQKLKVSNSPITKDVLLQLMDEYTDIPLAKNGQALWEAFVGTQPVRWTAGMENNDVKYYPILFRKHHALADAGHFFKGIVEFFADNKNVKVKCAAHISQTGDSESTPQKLFSSKIILNFFIRTGLAIKLYVRQLGILLLFPSTFLVYSLLMVNGSHILHGPKPTSRKHLFLNAEEFPRYIEVVKRIKKKIPGCTFEDVCLTAIAASFAEYFQQHSSYIPDYISAEVPALPPKMNGLEKPKVGEMFCCNRLTFAVRKLPTKVDLEKPNTLINMLQSVGKEGTLMRLSLEREINYLFFTVACYLGPSLLVRLFISDILHTTSVVSNVHGPSFMTVMGGCPVQDMSAWTTTRGRTGICFTILTYDDRLQLSMAIDESLTPNRNDAQSLIDGVYKYLDILEHDTITIPPDKNPRQLNSEHARLKYE